jgi:uncharacterized damage-inducible protein DinB
MDAVTLLKDQVKQAHDVYEGTVADLTTEQAHWKPGGTANSCAPLLAHIAAAEDMFLNMMTGRQPLAMGPYAGKTGASEPHPMGNYGEWAGRVTVDLPQLSEYVKAVFKNTEDYVAGLTPEDLDKEMDLSAAGMGKMSLGSFITMTSVIHPSNHTGEISCMKGLQGAKGYPF